MKITYTLIAALLFIALTNYLLSCKDKRPSHESDEQTMAASDTMKVHNVSENHYQDLRNMALRVTPEQLHLSLPADRTKVFGVIMDWDLGEGIATFVSFETGDASMYLSSGGGMIGGSGHENVVNAAKAFVARAQNYLEKASKVENTPLPDKNCVRFYMLTNKGTFSAQEQLKNFDNRTSAWLPLFEEGNKVITELRIVEEKLQKH